MAVGAEEASHPSPQTLRRQKLVYDEALDAQVRLGLQALNSQVRLQREQIHLEAADLKRKYMLDTDREVHRAIMHIENSFESSCENLRRQAAQRKTEMHEQAIALADKYHQDTQEAQRQRTAIALASRHKSYTEQMEVEMARFHEMGQSLLDTARKECGIEHKLSS